MDPMKKKIKIKPKIRVTPKKKLNIKARELNDEEKFEREAETLRQKMADKGLETKTRLKPTAAQLQRWKNAKESS